MSMMNAIWRDGEKRVGRCEEGKFILILSRVEPNIFRTDMTGSCAYFTDCFIVSEFSGFQSRSSQSL